MMILLKGLCSICTKWRRSKCVEGSLSPWRPWRTMRRHLCKKCREGPQGKVFKQREGWWARLLFRERMVWWRRSGVGRLWKGWYKAHEPAKARPVLSCGRRAGVGELTEIANSKLIGSGDLTRILVTWSCQSPGHCQSLQVFVLFFLLCLVMILWRPVSNAPATQHLPHPFVALFLMWDFDPEHIWLDEKAKMGQSDSPLGILSCSVWSFCLSATETRSERPQHHLQ